MKAMYFVMLIVGSVLLLATESESVMPNIIGLITSVAAAYKLGMFDEANHIKE